MCTLRETGVAFSEWRAYFPKIWPKALEKKGELSGKFGTAYFRKGLDLLFHIELLSKSVSLPTEALLDYFRIKL